MTATLLPNAKQQFLDTNGRPLAGGQVYFYIPNTSTFKSTWQDAGKTILNTNPVILDSRGQAVIYGDGQYRQVVYDVHGNLIWDKLTDSYALNSEFQSLASGLGTSSGASLIGFIQNGVGAVFRNLLDRGRDRVNGADFGMVADWNGTTGTNNASKLTAALQYVLQRGGGTLTINPGDYYLGAYATSALVVSVTGLKNTRINAYGARFIVNTTALATPFMLVFDSPNNVVLAGASFTDIGFDPARWGTANDRWGAVAVALPAAQSSSGFRMVDCNAQSMSTLLLSDQRANKRNLKNITVDNCTCDTTYYGVNVLYVGDNLKVDNLRCKDVRRTLIGYGMRNVDADIKLYTSQGFLGSNAAVSIACEGQAYNDGYGVLGGNGDVNNIRVKLNVFGFEAHSAYVHFYNQQADSAGVTSNVSADVKVSVVNVGKNPAVGNTDVFLFDHELPNGSITGSTLRTYKQINLHAEINGSVSGVPVNVQSVNTASPMTMSLSPNLTALAQTYTINQLTNPTNCNLLTPFERVLTTLTPVGTTTAGVPTGLVSNGTWTLLGKRVLFNAQVSWTNHTGTGALRLNGLPLPIDTNFPAQAIVTIGSGLAHTAGSTLVATLGGTGNTQVLFFDESAGNISTVNLDTSVAALYVSGSYVTP
jgi:hypothetical protein